ncbi:MAG: SGNH/GDSL hydrolase family protein [Anaerolineales bacterium]|nr:SGNH/GDSL hydrolase family protein [Anaerolineales bacterium]
MVSLKRGLVLGLKILLTIVLSFLFLEFLLLVFNDVVFRKSLYMYDPDLGYKARPYAHWGDNITNEFGFNDRDYPHQKKPGTYRILFVGDSFSWAGGLEGNYTAILEKKFEAEFGDSRVEIINTGYDATHTGEQLKALKKYGLQYNPDLVVLAFFVGNDFFDATPWRRRINVGGSQVDIDTRTDTEIALFGKLVVPFRSRLYLFCAINGLPINTSKPNAKTVRRLLTNLKRSRIKPLQMLRRHPMLKYLATLRRIFLNTIQNLNYIVFRYSIVFWLTRWRQINLRSGKILCSVIFWPCVTCSRKRIFGLWSWLIPITFR